MENVASAMVWDALSADRREGVWRMSARISGEGTVEAALGWRADGADAVADLAGTVTFPSLADYSDFKAFWRQAGGDVAES